MRIGPCAPALATGIHALAFDNAIMGVGGLPALASNHRFLAVS